MAAFFQTPPQGELPTVLNLLRRADGTPIGGAMVNIVVRDDTGLISFTRTIMTTQAGQILLPPDIRRSAVFGHVVHFSFNGTSDTAPAERATRL